MARKAKTFVKHTLVVEIKVCSNSDCQRNSLGDNLVRIKYYVGINKEKYLKFSSAKWLDRKVKHKLKHPWIVLI